MFEWLKLSKPIRELLVLNFGIDEQLKKFFSAELTILLTKIFLEVFEVVICILFIGLLHFISFFVVLGLFVSILKIR